MANLLSTLATSTGALSTIDRVLEVTQNNVSNASTPGYAKQTQILEAMSFAPDLGTAGGVRTGELKSARDEFSEQAVRRQTSMLGESQQNVSSLTALQGIFDVTGDSGIPAALNNLYQSFSNWSINTSGTVARDEVLQRAGDVARAFQQTASALGTVASDTEKQIQSTVDQVNTLAKQLRGYNVLARSGAAGDAGLDAQMHSTLEQMSQLVDISAVKQQDGSFTVVVGGSVPLVAGAEQYDLTSTLAVPQTPAPTYSGAPASAVISGPDGTDITSRITGGELGALLDVRNNSVAALMGSGTQQGELNVMAKSFADRVNAILTSGNVSDGPPAVQGSPVFTYDTTNDTAVARTLAVDPNVKSSDLGAIDPGPPYVSNGIALRLSALSTPSDTADKIDSYSFNEYYGVIAGKVGSALSDAKNGTTVQESLLAQAKNLRQQVSGVSLDEEATILIEFQRGYQANAKMISVLDTLTQSVIDILR